MLREFDTVRLRFGFGLTFSGLQQSHYFDPASRHIHCMFNTLHRVVVS